MAVLSRPAILSKQIAVLSKPMAVLCLMSPCKEACLQAAIAALSSSPNGRFASKAKLKHVTRACLDKVTKLISLDKVHNEEVYQDFKANGGFLTSGFRVLKYRSYRVLSAQVTSYDRIKSEDGAGS